MFSNIHFREILTKGGQILFVRSLGAGLSFLLQILLARRVDQVEFGIYSYCVTLLMLFSSVGRFGLDLGLVKQVSTAELRNGNESANAWLLSTLIFTVIFSTIISLPLYLSAETISALIFKDTRYAPVVMIFISLVPLYSIMFLLAEGLRGKKATTTASTIQVLIIPSVIISYLLLSNDSIGLIKIGYLYICGIIFGIVLGVYSWFYLLRPAPILKVSYIGLATISRYGLPYFIGSIGSIVLTWSDTLIVGMVSEPENIAAYYAACKIATLTSFVLISVNSIAAPKYAALYASGDIKTLEKISQLSTLLVALLALLPALIFVIFADELMSLYGKGYNTGSIYLIILTLGQYINVLCGSVGLMLVMSHNQSLMAKVYIISAILTCAVSYLLGKEFGALGVAVGTALGTAFWNVWMLILVKKKVGFWMFSFKPKIFYKG